MEKLSRLFFAGFCLAAGASLAQAQAYPSKPIRWVVPLPAGGGMDIMTRAVVSRVQPALGQSIVVDNRPGAGGIIGTEVTARAPGDGYTLLSADNGILTMNPYAYRKLPYDSLKDFQPVTTFAKLPFLLVVNPSLVPATDLKGVLAQVKANPGKLGYGSFGAGSVSHIFMELLKQRTGADVVHVPYKGAAPALQDLVAGQVAMMIVDYGASRGFITSEKIRPIITTTREAHARLPTLPTAEAAGVRDYNVYGWVGLLAPAGTPMPVVNRLREEVVKAVPELTKQYADLGIAFETRTPEQFSELIRQDLDRWGPVMKSMNLQLD